MYNVEAAWPRSYNLDNLIEKNIWNPTYNMYNIKG
jgi:hypothetical protein